MKDNDSLTEKIINCCFKVHNELGPGFKERIYHNALELFLDEDGLKYETEKLFEVNIKEWKDEVESIEEYYKKFGDKLPEAIKQEFEKMKKAVLS